MIPYTYSPTHRQEDGCSNIAMPPAVTPTNGDSSEFIRIYKVFAIWMLPCQAEP